MPVCGKCGNEIAADAKMFICPDCGAEFHDECHNITYGLCPVCTLCGVNPVKQIEMLQFIKGTQPTSLDPEGYEPGIDRNASGGVNREFEMKSREEQIECINRAMETSPRVLVESTPRAKMKEWIVAFPALLCAYFLWQGFAGDFVSFIIAVVIALGCAIWWFKF